MIKNLINLLTQLDCDDLETLDLAKEEDYKKFKDAIKSIRQFKDDAKNNPISKFISLFIEDSILDDADKYADEVYNKAKAEKKDEKVCKQCQCECKCPCDDCEEEYCDDCEYFNAQVDPKKDNEKKIIMPSELLDNTDIKLQIHHLVTEYCDNYIKPYVDDKKLGNELANNAYAGLYEFACWLYNHK